MSTPASAARVSVVMPVLNEETGIVDALAPLQAWRRDGAEVIVVDGDSDDDTAARAAPLCDRVLVVPRGRARQMNAGVDVARGGLLLFLHADTRLPDDAPVLLAWLAAGPPTWGRFDITIDGTQRWLRSVATLMNLRSRLTGVATGDQAIFAARELFAAVGGYPDIELMEDVALSKCLRRRQPPVCLRARVTTSGRRWAQGGLWRTVMLMWSLRLAYFLGADPARLARWYRQVR